MSRDETERKNHVSSGEHIPVSNGQCCWDASRLAAMHEVNSEINVLIQSAEHRVKDIEGGEFVRQTGIMAGLNVLKKRLGEGKK